MVFYIRCEKGLQAELHPKDKDKTAFSTKYGLWHFNVMMFFELSNAPAIIDKLF